MVAQIGPQWTLPCPFGITATSVSAPHSVAVRSVCSRASCQSLPCAENCASKVEPSRGKTSSHSKKGDRPMPTSLPKKILFATSDLYCPARDSWLFKKIPEWFPNAEVTDDLAKADIIFHSTNTCDTKVLHQHLCHIRTKKSRQCRSEMDVLDPQIQQ